MKITILFFLLVLSTGFSSVQPGKEKEKFQPEKIAAEILPGIWMSKTEVSNEEYMEFLVWLIRRNRTNEVPELAPDVTVWKRDLAFNDPYSTYYFSHEAFSEYPVVGISYESAIVFCEFLTDKYFDPNSDTKYIFRLPTEKEWDHAAGKEKYGEHFYPGGWSYPRGGKGEWRFNHKLGYGDYAGWAGGDGRDYEGYMITAPVESFEIDRVFNLYNLTGNVAEMVAEKGIAKGGSWAHEGNDCKIGRKLEYSEPTAWLGMRVVFEVVHQEVTQQN